MRLLFITDFFPPETNAAATRVFERARRWVEWGHEVTVLTSAPNFPQGKVYDGYRNRWHQVEILEGVRVVRVKTYMARNQGKWRRGFDFISFLFTSLPTALIQQRPDVVLATSPNFFAGLAGCLAAIFRRVPFVLEIGDLWPAFVISVGGIRRSFLLKQLERIELFMYRRADVIVCLSGSFKRILSTRGVPPSKIEVILNGVEQDVFTPGEPDEVLRRKYNPDNAFVVGYFGTLGAAHGLDSALDAAALLPLVRFLFVGDGVASTALRNKCKEMRLENVTFVPPQPREAMPGFLRLCDVALVQLRDLPLLNSAIPSKIFEAMSVARPVLLAAPEGDAAALIRQEGCGIHVPAADPNALAQQIERLKSDPLLLEALGVKGREAATAYSRETQARLVLEAAREVVGRSASDP